MVNKKKNEWIYIKFNGRKEMVGGIWHERHVDDMKKENDIKLREQYSHVISTERGKIISKDFFAFASQ